MIMREIGLEERKKLQLDILVDVASYCERNHITYFLSSGTLIGAVRHQGYIPWDDDIDIMMPRPDYERFAKEYSSEVYEFTDMNKDKDFPYVLGKVWDIRTQQKEERINYNLLGVNIDIFPLDGLSENFFLQKLHLFIIGLLTNVRRFKRIVLKDVMTKWKKFCFALFKFFLLAISYKSLANAIYFFQKRYKWSSAVYVSSLASTTERLIGKKEWFEKPIQSTFEKYTFFIPNGYANWLTLVYGDYMKLPPKEKRSPHHVVKAYWRN